MHKQIVFLVIAICGAKTWEDVVAFGKANRGQKPKRQTFGVNIPLLDTPISSVAC